MVCTSAGRPSSARVVSPSPALTAAHEPVRLGLVIATRQGVQLFPVPPAPVSDIRTGVEKSKP